MKLEVSSIYHWTLDLMLKPKYRQIVNYGGSRCFVKGQKVITKNGLVSIEDVMSGDIVLTYNLETKKEEWNKVLLPLKNQTTERIIKIKLKNGGELKCTENHKIFLNGGWVCAKDILSLHNERNMEAVTDNAI